MALTKSKIIERGDEVTYWKWIQQNRSDHSKTSQYILGGWKNKQERNAYPGQPRAFAPFEWSGATYPFDVADSDPTKKTNDAQTAYALCKLPTIDPDSGQPIPSFFADAVDA
jgi:hypothetical protein